MKSRKQSEFHIFKPFILAKLALLDTDDLHSKQENGELCYVNVEFNGLSLWVTMEYMLNLESFLS